MNELTPARIAELAKDEYLQVQHFYEDIENRSLQIKNWSITVSSSIIGGGLLTSGWLFLLGATAAVLFWYRGFQFYLAKRIVEIETYFRPGATAPLAPFQLFTRWGEEFTTHGPQTRKYFFTQLAALPHAFLAIAALGLFLLWIFGFIAVPIRIS